MEKTIEIQLAEQRERIATWLESLVCQKSHDGILKDHCLGRNSAFKDAAFVIRECL